MTLKVPYDINGHITLKVPYDMNMHLHPLTGKVVEMSFTNASLVSSHMLIRATLVNTFKYVNKVVFSIL